MAALGRFYFHLGPSPSPELQCTLQSVSGGTEMVLQWSDEFNAEHVVERYNVRVSPDPASCTSDQVPPHQNYSCSGIDVMSTNYSVSVTAFNCINQEGEGITYDVQPQLMGMCNYCILHGWIKGTIVMLHESCSTVTFVIQHGFVLCR